MDQNPPPRRGRHSRGFAFVGRDRELELLLHAVADRPAVALVEGEAGIGKSRLVAEATDRLRSQGVHVIAGSCHPLREPLAYGPVIDALRDVGVWLPADGSVNPSAGIIAPLLPDLADRLPPPPDGDTSPGAQRHAMVNGVRSLLSAVVPVVLVVEDVHWADEATRELLLLLAGDLPDDVALVLTYRAEELHDLRPVLGGAFRPPQHIDVCEISLGRLGGTALRDLARSALGPDATPALVDRLLERSEGLPLVIEEDLITLVDRAAGAPGPVAVPRGLKEILAARIERLTPEAAAVVDAAAALAVPASETLLTSAAGLDDHSGAAALTGALGASVLRELGPDRYGFGHALARQAVYDALPGPARSRIHRQVRDVLSAQQPPPLVQIAHHTLALGDLATWVVQAQAAADQAVALGDLGTAAALLRQILEKPDLPTEQLSRAALALGSAVLYSTDATDSAAALNRIMETPGLSTTTRGEIRTYLAFLLLNHVGDAAGWVELERSVEELEKEMPALAARNLAVLAASDTGPSTAAQQRAMMERALTAAERTDDPIARATVHRNYVVCLLYQADPTAGDLLAAMPRDPAEPEIFLSTVVALSSAAETAFYVGLDNRVAGYNEEALALGRRITVPALLTYIDSYRVLLEWTSGHWHAWDRGLADYRARHPDSPLTDHGLLGTAQGVTAAARGLPDQAARHFERVIAQDEMCFLSLGAAAGLARLALARHDPDAAWTALGRALEILHRKECWPHAWDLVPTAVETALLRGDRSAAETLAVAQDAGSRGRECPAARAEHHLCLGLLKGSGPAAAAEFEQARTRWLDIGRPYPAALAAERAARAIAEDDAEAAAATVTLAAQDLRRIGATSDAARCHQFARTLGHRRGQRATRRDALNGLSPRETEIAEFLARGASNKEIAAALFLSVRTVEHHVANVLRKLGTTRKPLADRSEAPPGE